MTEEMKLKHFEIKCKECNEIATIEIRNSVSYRNDTDFDYAIVVCKKCGREEELYQ